MNKTLTICFTILLTGFGYSQTINRAATVRQLDALRGTVTSSPGHYVTQEDTNNWNDAFNRPPVDLAPYATTEYVDGKQVYRFNDSVEDNKFFTMSNGVVTVWEVIVGTPAVVDSNVFAFASFDGAKRVSDGRVVLPFELSASDIDSTGTMVNDWLRYSRGAMGEYYIGDDPNWGWSADYRDTPVGITLLPGDDATGTINGSYKATPAVPTVTNIVSILATEDFVINNLPDITPYALKTEVPDYEQDVKAMKLLMYDNADIIITPTNAFEFTVANGEATITGYSGNYADIVIPYEFYGSPVVAVGDNVFKNNYDLWSISGSRNLLTIGHSFATECGYLLTITLPSVSSIGSWFTYDSPSLERFEVGASLVFADQSGAFLYDKGDDYYLNESVTVYVTNPQAQGWGDTYGSDTYGGRPVVFPNGRYDGLTAKSLTLSIEGTEPSHAVTKAYVDNKTNSIGSLADLETDNKYSIVGAINEVNKVFATFPPAGNVNLGTTNNAVLTGTATCYEWAPTVPATLSITTQPRYPFDMLFMSDQPLNHGVGIINMSGWESGSLTNLLYFRPHSDGVKWELWE